MMCHCCAALFESYHLRHELAVQAFNKLPLLKDFPTDAVPRAPYPGRQGAALITAGMLLASAAVVPWAG